MAKPKVVFVCSECGGEHLRWQGKCQFCGVWNTLREVTSGKSQVTSGERKKPQKLSKLGTSRAKRTEIGIGEFDRVLGGGLVGGSVVLLSGSPGVGKSTILLQSCGKIAKDSSVVYVSGEEAEEQVVERAKRLKVEADNLYFLAQSDLDLILSELADMEDLGLVIVDSLQTTSSENATGSSGSPSQIKYAATELSRFAKEKGVPVVMTGHVTKNFAIGGPKFLEHIVDVVLIFEGDRFSSLRVLRSSKNRFGGTSEVGIFEMKKEGLVEVKDPSEVFLKKHKNTPGSALMIAVEGTRPILLEIQALTSSTTFHYPKRTTQGLSSKRALLILAVLEKFGRINLSRSDIFVKSSFGMRVFEPAADLAIAIAVASSRLKKPVPAKLCFFAEVGLNGEVKPVSQEEERVKHAKKLGLKPVSAGDYSTVQELLNGVFE
ncbi:DNA repair protein RadA [Candidatus Saccharibacteria bacterium]|nr:DNA repair protein RadA [Candidatus Saccharibacteria bacterium]